MAGRAAPPAPHGAPGRPAFDESRRRRAWRRQGATVGLLDSEGLAGFSTRRLAAVSGELGHPVPEAGQDWREQLRTPARENRALLVRHPWLSRPAGTYLNIGPNAPAFSRSVQTVVRRSGLPAHRVTGTIAAVFQIVHGYGTIEGPDVGGVIEDAREIMAARGGDTVAEMPARDFEFAPALLVAGIEAMVERG